MAGADLSSGAGVYHLPAAGGPALTPLRCCRFIRPSYRAQWQLGLRLLLQKSAADGRAVFIDPAFRPDVGIPDIKSATTGLNEEVTPGDIAQLSRSSALAFRASFDGPLPPENQRYWRALVHEEFDGKTWRVAQSLRQWYQQQTNRLPLLR